MMTSTSKELLSTLGQKELDDAFILACKNGDLTTVKYVLTSSKLQNHADIHCYGDFGLRAAFYYKCLNVIKYLFSSGYYKINKNISFDSEGNESYLDRSIFHGIMLLKNRSTINEFLNQLNLKNYLNNSLSNKSFFNFFF